MRSDRKELANPALTFFLKDRIQSTPSLKPTELADRSRGRFSESDIELSLRNLIYMSADKAQALLALTGLEEEWARLGAEGHRPQSGRHIGYTCRKFGRVEAWTLNDIQAAGLPLLDVARQLVAIDAGLFAHFSTDEWIGTPEDWRDAMQFEPRAWQVFMGPGGEVLGYWMFVTPKDELFRDACLGGYPEHQITVETLKRLGDGPCHIYGPGLYVRSDVTGWDRKVLGSYLLTAFLHAVRTAEEEGGVTFDRICIPVCSEEGRRLAEDRFGLQRMPPVINEHYARAMGWPLIQDGKTLLPAIYLGDLGEALRRRAGLSRSGEAPVRNIVEAKGEPDLVGPRLVP